MRKEVSGGLADRGGDVSPGKKQHWAQSREQRGDRYKTSHNMREPAHSWARGEVSGGLADRGGDVSPGNRESPLAEKIRWMVRWCE